MSRPKTFLCCLVTVTTQGDIIKLEHRIEERFYISDKCVPISHEGA